MFLPPRSPLGAGGGTQAHHSCLHSSPQPGSDWGGRVSEPQPSYVKSSQFTVIGPDRPVTASLGGEAILPCHLSPRMSAQKMEVRWFRSQFSAMVHLCHDGQDQYAEQMLEYRGRTELLRDDITNGRVSLRIWATARPCNIFHLKFTTIIFTVFLSFIKSFSCLRT
uniref:Immunoglobulin V-set domain-containing protein n=1 Tax=Gopherus agassizii TaxID=38772 RepID=A0A452IBG6_9SAUR